MTSLYGEAQPTAGDDLPHLLQIYERELKRRRSVNRFYWKTVDKTWDVGGEEVITVQTVGREQSTISGKLRGWQLRPTQGELTGVQHNG